MMKSSLVFSIVLIGGTVLADSSLNQFLGYGQKEVIYQKHDTTKMKNGYHSKANTHKGVTHAKAKTIVNKYERTVYDEPQEGPALTKNHMEESFEGDIKGEGIAEILQTTNHADESSNLVCIERVTGKIGEKEGTSLLQVAGTIVGIIVACDWFVIPRSGTGQLTGLRGEGGFRANLGQGGEVHLDYWFE